MLKMKACAGGYEAAFDCHFAGFHSGLKPAASRFIAIATNKDCWAAMTGAVAQQSSGPASDGPAGDPRPSTLIAVPWTNRASGEVSDPSGPVMSFAASQRPTFATTTMDSAAIRNNRQRRTSQSRTELARRAAVLYRAVT